MKAQKKVKIFHNKNLILSLFKIKFNLNLSLPGNFIMKPHIVHLIASSGLYGAEKWILALIRALDSGRFTSTLINLSDKRNDVSAVVDLAKEYGLNACDFHTGGTYNPLSIVRLSRWLTLNKVNIVHGHGYKADLIGLLSARVSGCKMIATPHGWSKEADIKLKCYEMLDRYLFRHMDYVCPLSDDLLESVKHCVKPDKMRLIMNGVDIAEVTDALRLDIPSGRGFRIGYVGQLIERKNLSVLIRAIKVLTERRDEFMLIVVGDGSELNALKELSENIGIKERVHFLGYRKDALSIMKSFDIFVLPSLLEGIPRCIMEAMTAKISVVASNIPGNCDIVHDGKTGLLFEKMDHGDLANKIDKLCSDNNLRLALSKQGYELIKKQFSNHRMALEYQALYQQISQDS